MNVVVNGKARVLEDQATVSDLVAELGLSDRNVVVELNREPLDRESYTGVRLSPGDVVEIVRAVAGG
jgi:thiazole synthase